MWKVPDKLQAAENKRKKVLDFGVHAGSQYEPMKKQPIPTKVALRPTAEDYSIISRLRSKLGVDNSQIIRIALRKLAEAEGLKAS